jgi:hypothetical protein
VYYFIVHIDVFLTATVAPSQESQLLTAFKLEDNLQMMGVGHLSKLIYEGLRLETLQYVLDIMNHQWMLILINRFQIQFLIHHNGESSQQVQSLHTEFTHQFSAWHSNQQTCLPQLSSLPDINAEVPKQSPLSLPSSYNEESCEQLSL